MIRRRCAAPSKAEDPWRAAEAILARLVALSFVAEARGHWPPDGLRAGATTTSRARGSAE